MTKFRKGDVVTINGVVKTDYEVDGKIEVRIEPYHAIFVPVAEIKMQQPVIEVGDTVAYPSEGYKTGEVLAIIDGYCWVRLDAKKNYFSPLGTGADDGQRVTWPLASVNRVDPDPDQAEEAA